MTLGGGFEYLCRKYGLTIDNLRSVDVVTAGGELVHASETQNPELFWGIRSGSGNFGIVGSVETLVTPCDFIERGVSTALVENGS